MSKQVHFDPHDLKGMNALMDDHEKYPEMLFGENEHGEKVTISINADNIYTTTEQKNGYLRVNIYYRNGGVEETFEGRWDGK